MTTVQRVKALTDLGLTYSEKYRNFYHPTKGHIDIDVVTYADDKEFLKKLNKLKK